MSKVVVDPLKLSKNGAVKTKRIRLSNGVQATIRVIDADSPTFASDLTHVFTANVARARRANTSMSSASFKVAEAWRSAQSAEPKSLKKSAKKKAVELRRVKR